MSFLTGSVTARQFTTDARPDTQSAFGEEDIERLQAFAMERSKLAAADGVEVGWGAGGHLLDSNFSCAKNLRGEFLVFDFRVNVERLPNELVKAYTAIELYALSANNPSGMPTARQKREARESARERLEQEAKDGRFTKRSIVPVVWDIKTGRVWFGTSAITHVGRFVALFQQTFGIAIDPVRPGLLAPTMPVGAVAQWVPGVTPEEYAWVDDHEAGDWLGNEFLTWLMTELAGPKDEIELPDGRSAVAMFARKLKLECPRGQGGTAGFGHDGPPRLPEVRRAMQAGKLPRSAGLTVVVDNEQFEFSLDADQWVISGGKLPRPEDEITDPAQRQVQRLESVRALFAAAESLYGAFASVRTSTGGMTAAVTAFRRWVGLAGGDSKSHTGGTSDDVGGYAAGDDAGRGGATVPAGGGGTGGRKSGRGKAGGGGAERDGGVGDAGGGGGGAEARSGGPNPAVDRPPGENRSGTWRGHVDRGA